MADMIVAGAGTTAVNGTYVEYGVKNGRPAYSLNGDKAYIYYYSSWLCWVISATLTGASNYYASSGYPAAATPDLEPGWVCVSGSSPAPTVTAAGGSTEDDLTATNITSGIPTLGTPTLAQKHALTATAITSGIPGLGTPTLGQKHALTATAITSGIPTLGKPNIGEAYVLSATNVTSGIPTLGTPTISQTHIFSATGITAGTPTLSTATIGQTHKLSATNITGDPAILGAPVITQIYALSATGITTGTPVLGKPTISQTHILSANGITNGTPALGSPDLGLIYVLTATGITGAPATLGSPSIGQIHVLSGIPITSGEPLLSVPTLAQVHALVAIGIMGGLPVLGSPLLQSRPRVDIPYTEVMAFTVKAFITAALSVELPNETSIDVDVMGEVVSGAGSSGFNGEYVYDSIVGTKPYYRKGSYYIVWTFGAWYISDGDANNYESTDDVATPDLCTTWTVYGTAQLPVPTVTITALSTTPVLGALVPLTVEMPQSVTMTVYKELSK